MGEERIYYDCDTLDYWCSDDDYNGVCKKEFGRFSDDGKSYEIFCKDTPRPWLNYLCNSRIASAANIPDVYTGGINIQKLMGDVTNMEEIKTVLGNISSNEVGVVLPHEHIYCYSDYLYEMGGSKYLDKEKVFGYAIERFKMLKEKHNLKTFIDCTPINIGRDIQMLRRISEATGINIICSTGFYYTEESLLYNMAAETLCEYIINDALNTNAGIIKCAVEELTPYAVKILRATAKAQLKLGLPIIIHTNVDRRNGVQALEIILSEGVKPQAVTVGHLSDTDDCEYIKSIAKYGCYIALDRFYEICNKDYITQKVDVITKLCSEGFEEKILLSHDALFFSGLSGNPEINPFPRFNYLFENILPELTESLSRKVTIENPLNMLKCI